MLLGLTSIHTFLLLVLGLIQDIRKCTSVPVDDNQRVPTAFRSLSTDAQAMISRLFGAFRSVLSGFGAGSSAWGPGSPPPAAASRSAGALLPRVASALGAALRQHRLQRHHDAFRAAAAPRTAAAHPGAVRLPSAVRIRVPSGPKTSRERCSELGRQFSAQDARSSRRKWREEEENLLQNGLFGSARPSLGRK